MPSPLFQAKATINGNVAVFDIFKLSQTKYRAVLDTTNQGEEEVSAPQEITVTKNNGIWEADDLNFAVLGATLGLEIDVFNNGYGELLGRIGVE